MKTLLRRKMVEAKTGHSTSTIYEKMAAGEFPKPVRLGARAVGWVEEEIDSYIEERIAERNASRSVAFSEMRERPLPRVSHGTRKCKP